MFEHVLLAARNGNYAYPDFKNGSWHYNDPVSDGTLPSGGKEYKKGMNLYVDHSYAAAIYYNLESKYSKLVGKIAFADRNANKIDIVNDIKNCA